MAIQTYVVPKIGQVGSIVARRSTNATNPFNNVINRYVQAGSGSSSHQDLTNVAKRGLNEALRTGENLKNKAASTTEDIAESSKEAAQSVADKAKQVAQGAWDSAKDTAQKTKDMAFDMADDATETAKETVDRSMNTKNNPNC